MTATGSSQRRATNRRSSNSNASPTAAAATAATATSSNNNKSPTRKRVCRMTFACTSLKFEDAAARVRTTGRSVPSRTRGRKRAEETRAGSATAAPRAPSSAKAGGCTSCTQLHPHLETRLLVLNPRTYKVRKPGFKPLLSQNATCTATQRLVPAIRRVRVCARRLRVLAAPQQVRVVHSLVSDGLLAVVKWCFGCHSRGGLSDWLLAVINRFLTAKYR